MPLDTLFMFAGLASTPFGRVPEEAWLEDLPPTVGAIVLMHHGLYIDGNHAPPWNIPLDRQSQLRRFCAAAWNRGIAVCPYVSIFYEALIFGHAGNFVTHVRRLWDQGEFHGLYCDGYVVPYNDRVMNPGYNKPAVAAMRSIVGKSGRLILHATHHDGRGNYALPQPKIESQFDLVLRGEGVDLTVVGEDWLNTHLLASGAPNFAAASNQGGIAWLASHGASAIGHVGMRTEYGITVFDDGVTSSFRALVAARGGK